MPVPKSSRRSSPPTAGRALLPSALAIDDDPQILKAYARVLRDKFKVTTCSSAAEALERIARPGYFHDRA